MASNGYTLSNCEMLNELILAHERICIATKRGLNGVPFYRWFTRGRDQYDVPLTYALHAEVSKFVDIAWLGGPNKECLATVTLSDDNEMLDIESASNTRSLNNYYPSFKQ